MASRSRARFTSNLNASSTVIGGGPDDLARVTNALVKDAQPNMQQAEPAGSDQPGGEDVSGPVVAEELEQIAASARAMSDVITTLVDVARDHAAAGAASTSRAADVAAAIQAMVPAELTFVDETSTSTARVAGPRELVLRALAPIVDNAVAHARTTVTLTAVDTARGVEISVSDDGPGVDDELRDALFDVGASTRGGTGLGLGIAQRVARSMGGRVDVGEADTGARFVVTLPRA
jgi:signal transduction histidine kinase